MRQISRQQLFRLKAFLFLLALLPLARLFWLGFNDNLTANPIEFIERSTGTWALICLLVALALTPVRLVSGISWPIQLRRMAGLFMFFYACLHFATYLWLDHWFDWNEISKHIIEHPYVLVGFSAFVLSIPLALTSNNTLMRRLGSRWKQLHYAVYLIAALGVLHFWWLVKKDIREPLVYAIILAVLLGIRVYYRYKKYHVVNAGPKGAISEKPIA
ncbi:MAG: sulfoxide reductase heme-binding subunit YedZ [Betaproteobacteria bacterium HGW-Betaproteobacteria-1]|nr:MAG: sulfoxide reductase heme-binding subunit YedZ [Betaproteobacteria bacterium HGW-Betaproteobacteria-1]